MGKGRDSKGVRSPPGALWAGKAKPALAPRWVYSLPPSLQLRDGVLSFFSLDSHLSFLWLIYKLALHHLPSSFCCLLFSVTMNPRGRRRPPIPRKPVYASALEAVGFEPTKAAMFSDGSPWRASRTLLLHRGISRSLESWEDSFLMGIHPRGQPRALTFSRHLPAQVGVSMYSKINDLLGLDTRARVPLPFPSSLRTQLDSAAFQTQAAPSFCQSTIRFAS